MSYCRVLRANASIFQKVRLYSYQQNIHNNVCTLILNRKRERHKLQLTHIQRRHFSLQGTIESIASTQTGVFRFLSESTPVEYVQKFLLTLHDTSGLPWWATIVTATFIFRTCITAPLAIYQYYILAKVENISLEMKELAEELKKEVAIAIKLYKWDERTARYHFKKSLKKQWNNLIVRENCHPFKSGLLLWFQLPLWICFSISLRNLVYMLPNLDIDAQLRFIELTVGGFGWIPNLVQVDSTLILPLMLGILNLTIIEIQTLAKTNKPSRFQSFITNFFRGVSLIMIPISASVPSCLALYWTASSAFGLVQNLILLSPKARRFCRIPKAPSELPNPYSHVAIAFKNKISIIPGLSNISVNKGNKK